MDTSTVAAVATVIARLWRGFAEGSRAVDDALGVLARRARPAPPEDQDPFLTALELHPELADLVVEWRMATVRLSDGLHDAAAESDFRWAERGE